MSTSPNTGSSMRTDLGKVRYLGSAKSGTGENWHMRITSAALIPLTIAFVWVVLAGIGKDYNGARALMSNPFVAILMLLFIGAGLYHMQIGMKAIILDYVHTAHTKEWALIGNILFAILMGLACVYSVLRIGFA